MLVSILLLITEIRLSTSRAATEPKTVAGSEGITIYTPSITDLSFHNILNTLYTEHQCGAQDLATFPYATNISFIADSLVVCL